MADIKIIQTQLQNIIRYLQPLLPLANSHMVNFFTHNHWKNFIPTEIQNEYAKLGLPGLFKMFIHLSKINKESVIDQEVSKLIDKNPFLYQHILTSRKMCLGFENDVILSHSQFLEKFKYWGSCNTEEVTVKEFMPSKKVHEVEMMSHIVAAITDISKSSHIIDVGSGKGYLSTMLAFRHNLRVLGVDSSQLNTHGATKRKEKLQKYWPALYRRAVETSLNHSSEKHGKHWKSKSEKCHSTSELKDSDETNELPLTCCTSASSSLYKQTTLYISENVDTEQILKDAFPEDSTHTTTLVGLHTCGNLGSTSLKLFTQNQNIRALCNVGCCYHLFEEKFSPNPFHPEVCSENTEFGFPLSEFLTSQKFALGRNVRMLAAQSVERISAKEEVSVESLFYRAVLQVILNENVSEDRTDWNIGRIAAKCKNFVEYCDKSAKKLGVDLKLSNSQILEIQEHYLPRRDELVAYFLLRVSLAPVIEILILLDRLMYLLEQGIGEVNIVQLFDPVISPRCYGIIALKD